MFLPVFFESHVTCLAISRVTTLNQIKGTHVAQN